MGERCGCPHCKGCMKGEVWQKMGGWVSRGIVRELSKAKDGLTMPQIIRRVYSGTIDGGPDRAEESVRVMICLLRKKLRPHGFTISHGKSGGHRDPTKYRLIELEDAS